jgi:hypothetical protein
MVRDDGTTSYMCINRGFIYELIVGNIILAYTNIGCLNMDHCLIINDCLSFVLFCFMFDCLMFCNGDSLYEQDDRDPQCG